MGRGALIVLEGCDRSGKSTQCRHLVEYLESQGKKAELWRFPERSTAIGKVINDYIQRKCELSDESVHLLFSANRWELTPLMKEKLSNGITLVIDRYAFSGVAYTAAKDLDFNWCKSCDRGLPRPDVVFYLDISVDDASGRGEFGDERYEVSTFQKKVQGIYSKLSDDTWRVVDAKRTVDVIHNDLREQACQVIESCEDKPLQQLWIELEEKPKDSLVNGHS